MLTKPLNHSEDNNFVLISNNSSLLHKTFAFGPR